MINPVKIALMMLVAAATLATVTPAAARGGGSNIMNSPGYQRALEESRKRYQQPAQPSVQPSATHKRKKPRHHSTPH